MAFKNHQNKWEDTDADAVGSGFPPVNKFPDGSYDVEIVSVESVEIESNGLEQDALSIDMKVVSEGGSHGLPAKEFILIAAKRPDIGLGKIKWFLEMTEKAIQFASLDDPEILGLLTGLRFTAQKTTSTKGQDKNGDPYVNWRFDCLLSVPDGVSGGDDSQYDDDAPPDPEPPTAGEMARGNDAAESDKFADEVDLDDDDAFKEAF